MNRRKGENTNEKRWEQGTGYYLCPLKVVEKRPIEEPSNIDSILNSTVHSHKMTANP